MDHNHNLVRTGTSRPSHDAVEYAEFVDLDEQLGSTADSARRRRSAGPGCPRGKHTVARLPFWNDPTFWPSVRKATKALGIFLLAIVALVLGAGLMFASTNDSDHTQDAPATTAAPPALIDAADEAAPVRAPPLPADQTEQSPSATPGVGQLISGCYHLDSCMYWKVLDSTVLHQGPDWRLVQATLHVGTVADPAGTAADEKQIVWQDNRPDTYVALCSTTAPTLAWPSGTNYIAEEFDFGGDGVPGAQQDHANIYQALCHGFLPDGLADEASGRGYSALPDGGRGQYELANLDELIPRH